MRMRIKSILVVFMLMQVVHVAFMWLWLSRYGGKMDEIVAAINGVER